MTEASEKPFEARTDSERLARHTQQSMDEAAALDKKNAQLDKSIADLKASIASNKARKEQLKYDISLEKAKQAALDAGIKQLDKNILSVGEGAIKETKKQARLKKSVLIGLLFDLM